VDKEGTVYMTKAMAERVKFETQPKKVVIAEK